MSENPLSAMNQPNLTRRSFLANAASVALASSAAARAASSAVRFKIDASQARAVTITSDGHIVIAADRVLQVRDMAGKIVRETATPRPARAVCADAHGGVIVAFTDSVAHVSREGRIELVGDPFPKGSALTGIAASGDGRIFAADSAARVIWRLDADGRVLGQIRPGDHGFTTPRAFFPITWQDDHLVVAEPGRHQVLRYTKDGELVTRWGTRSREAGGFAGCCNPVAVAITADGSVITVERGVARVKQFDSRGRLMKELAGPDSFSAVHHDADDGGDLFGCEGGLFDVAAGRDGRVIVLDRAAREVLVLA